MDSVSIPWRHHEYLKKPQICWRNLILFKQEVKLTVAICHMQDIFYSMVSSRARNMVGSWMGKLILHASNKNRYLIISFNSSPPSASYMPQSIESALVQIMACRWNQCSNIVKLTFRKNQWNVKRNSYIFIQENVFENIVCEMVAILSQPQWVTSYSSDVYFQPCSFWQFLDHLPK